LLFEDENPDNNFNNRHLPNKCNWCDDNSSKFNELRDSYVNNVNSINSRYLEPLKELVQSMRPKNDEQDFNNNNNNNKKSEITLNNVSNLERVEFEKSVELKNKMDSMLNDLPQFNKNGKHKYMDNLNRLKHNNLQEIKQK